MIPDNFFDNINKKYPDGVKLKIPVSYKNIKKIEKKFNIKLDDNLIEILKICDGIIELIKEPETGKSIEISDILFSVNDIIESTDFISQEYELKNYIAISGDDSGNYFLMKSGNPQVYIFDTIDKEINLYSKNIIEFLL